jgi:uroporphyrinogen-III synthase
MKVLLTRPRQDSKRIAVELRKLNISSIISPVLCILLNPIEKQKHHHHQAVLLSSKHSIAGLSSLKIRKSLPIYCVGDATSYAVSDEGFSNVYSASGDINDLTSLVRKSLISTDGSILYLSGLRNKGEVIDDLECLGFEIENRVVYEAKAVQSLNELAIKALAKNEIQGVFLYSPRSAEIFVKMIEKLGFQKIAMNLKVYCLSSAVADSVKELKWNKVLIARRPNNLEMLALVNNKK